MRWSCPHCGTSLGLNDDKIGAGWAFSRCYRCAGHALIRRPEVNVIKVDRAPSGERVLLPEAHENILGSGSGAKVIPAIPRTPPTQPVISRPSRLPQLIPVSEITQKPLHPLPKSQAQPEPQPIVPNEPKPSRWTPHPLMAAAMGMMMTLMMGSGLYLFYQGKMIAEKSKQLEERQSNPAAHTTVIAQTPVRPAPQVQTQISDQVNQQAMAPVRLQNEIEEFQKNGPGILEMKQALENERKNEAPANLKSESARSLPGLIIQAKTKGVKLHTTPSVYSEVIGVANPTANYLVTEWNDRWFRVLIKGKPHLTAWVRNDQVHLISHSR